jgi:DNA damage-inducible protein 1
VIVKMKLTVLTADERIVSLDVEPDELVENLKAILEVETQVPLVQQQLLFNGKEVQNTMRLNAAGVGEDDLLMLVSAPTPSSAGGPAPSDLAFNPDGSAVNPIALQRHLRGDPNVMSQLQQVRVVAIM